MVKYPTDYRCSFCSSHNVSMILDDFEYDTDDTHYIHYCVASFECEDCKETWICGHQLKRLERERRDD
jgi:hypothetical protein